MSYIPEDLESQLRGDGIRPSQFLNEYGMNYQVIESVRQMQYNLFFELSMMGFLTDRVFVKQENIHDTHFYYGFNPDLTVEKSDFSQMEGEIQGELGDLFYRVYHYRNRDGDEVSIKINNGETLRVVHPDDSSCFVEFVPRGEGKSAFYTLSFFLNETEGLGSSSGLEKLRTLQYKLSTEYFAPALLERFYLSIPLEDRVDSSAIDNLIRMANDEGANYILPSFNALKAVIVSEEYKELSPDKTGSRAGLIWVLNPENWKNPDPVLADSAAYIWENLKFSNEFIQEYTTLSSPINIFQFLTMPTMSYDLFYHFSRVEGPELNQRYLEKLSDLTKDKVSPLLYDNFASYFYFVQIILLIRCNILEVPDFPMARGFQEKANRLCDYVVKTVGDAVSEVQFKILGQGPMRIKYKHYMQDPGKNRVYTAQEMFCWEMVERDPYNSKGEPQNPQLLIVAAPGVVITDIEAVSLVCDIKIYRVQDPALVPGWHRTITPALLEAPYTPEEFIMPPNAYMNPDKVNVVDVNTLPEGDSFRADPNYGIARPVTGDPVVTDNQVPEVTYKDDGSVDEVTYGEEQKETVFGDSSSVPAFHIAPTPTGVIITYPTIPCFGEEDGDPYQFTMEISVDPKAADQKFSFDIQEINTENKEGPPYYYSIYKLYTQYHLTVHYTGDVKIRVHENNPYIRGRFNLGWVNYCCYQIQSTREGADFNSYFLDAVGMQGIPLLTDYNHYHHCEGKDDTTAFDQKPGVIFYGPFEDKKKVKEGPDDSDLEAAVKTLYSLGQSAWKTVIRNKEGFFKFKLEDVYGQGELNHENEEFYAVLSNVRYETQPIGLLEMMAMDVGIGLIPIVGDIVDVVDLTKAILTGRDKWGHPVSELQLCLMAAGTLLPFVSAGAMAAVGKGAVRSSDTIVESVEAAATPLLTAQKRTDIPAETQESIVQLAARSDKPTNHLPADQVAEARKKVIDQDSSFLRSAEHESLSSATEQLLRRSDLMARAYISEFLEKGIREGTPIFDDILKDTKGGFMIPYIQTMYRRYVNNKNLSIPVEERTPKAFMDYVARGNNDNLKRLFKQLLGDGFKDLNVRGSTEVSTRQSWWKIDLFISPAKSTDRPLSHMYAVLKDTVELRRLVQNSIGNVAKNAAEKNVDVNPEFLSLINDPDNIDMVVKRIQHLFMNLSDDFTLEGVSEAVVHKLVDKKRPHSVEQVIEELTGGMSMLFDDMVEVASEGAEAMAPAARLEKAREMMEVYIRVPGSEDFFRKLMLRVQHSHGYIFEEIVNMNIIRQQMKEFATKAIDESDDLTLSLAERVKRNLESVSDPLKRFISFHTQATMESKSGPDAVAIFLKMVIHETGSLVTKRVAQIIQMKSFQDLQSLISSSNSGEILSQVTSDVSRILKVGGMHFNGKPIVDCDIDPTILYKIDWRRINKRSFMSQVNELIDATSLDTVIKEKLKNMHPLDVLEFNFKDMDFSAGEIKLISDQIRKLFVDEIIKNKMDDLNRKLIDLKDHWIKKEFTHTDEGVARTADEMKKALAEFFSSIPEESPRYFEVQEILEKAKRAETTIDDLVGDLGKYFDDAFDFSEVSNVTVKVELVDHKIDDLF